MDKGIYTALSGALAKSRELEVVANNLANASTPGFKKDTGTFGEYLTELRKPDSVEALKREVSQATMFNGRPSGDKAFVEMDAIYTDFRQGAINRTGRELDLALEGGGFFEVETPNGIRYTRQGNLSISKEGLLVTTNGYPVLAEGREVPAEQRLVRLKEGKVEISSDGLVTQGGLKMALLSAVEFHESQWLEKVGNGYFKNTHPANIRVGHTTNFHQGMLEGSNVNAIQEMTNLITVTRAYESHMQAIKTYQDVDGRTVNEIVTLK